MTEHASDPPLAPDAEQMLRHLDHLFGGFLDGCHEGRIELAYGNAGDGQIVHANTYGTDQFEAIVDQAVEINRTPGRNVYIGQALRKPETPPFGRCGDQDFFALTALYVDIDDDVRSRQLAGLALRRVDHDDRVSLAGHRAARPGR